MKNRDYGGKVLSAVLFALYIFIFLLTEFTVNERCLFAVGENYVVPVYSAGLLCTSLGYISFFLSRKIISDETSRRAITVINAAVYMGCTLLFMNTNNNPMFIISSFISLITLGYTGAFAHYTVSLFLSGKGVTGRVIGTAVAAATLFQYIVQNLLITDTTLIVSLYISTGAIIYIALKPVKDWFFENPLPYASAPVFKSRELIIPAAIVALMSLIFGLGDGLVTALHAEGHVNLSSDVRLLYMAGVFIAGFIADIRDRKFLPLCTLCMLVITSATALFIEKGNSDASIIYVSIMYVFSGFYVMYITITFMDKAPMTDKASLWAGMGRIIRGPFIALAAICAEPLLNHIGEHGIAVFGVVLSLLVLVLFVAEGSLDLKKEQQKKESSNMLEFAAGFKLTPRETEIFTLLLDNDATNKDIAADLFISLRVLERYITSIYEKAGVKSRIELMNRYYSGDYISDTQKHGETAEYKVRRTAEAYGLTPREEELLMLVYQYKSTGEMSEILGISDNTVKFHLKNLFKKMKVSNRGEAREITDKK